MQSPKQRLRDTENKKTNLLKVDSSEQELVINEEIDILKQLYAGLKPVFERLESESAAGIIALEAFYEHAWYEMNLKRNAIQIVHHNARKEKHLKFTTGWKKC